MKKLLLTLMLFVIATCGFAQVDGDYRSVVATGNWSAAGTWQIRSSGAWAAATVEPTATNNVYIQSGQTITVDAAIANSRDLHINSSGGVAIGINILNVSGKLRAYTGLAAVSSSDDSYTGTSTTTLASSMITTTSPGVLKFIGLTRNIVVATEWAGNTMTNDVEFALDANQVATITDMKFRNWTISSGILTTSSRLVATTNFTIKNGARVISDRSATANSILGASSSKKSNIFTIESGGVLELNGTTPAIDVTSFVNNGSVVYNNAGSQTLLQKASDATSTTDLNNYKILVLANTSAKTPFAPITVSEMIQFTGTNTSLESTASLPVTLKNNCLIDRGTASGTQLQSAAGSVFYGETGTDLINIKISTTNSVSNEIVASPTPGKYGTLTVNNGATYTFTGSRTITNLVNNGVVALIPSNSLTVNISGNISGSGTITGHPSASLNFTGSNSGSAGTLNFTNGSQFINNLTIDRTGTNASVTLGTSAAMSAVGTNQTGRLTVQNGILKIAPSVTLTVLSGNISNGTGTFNNSTYIETQNTGANVGKIILPAISVVKLIPTGSNGNYLPITLTPASSSDFSINVFNGATIDATTNGTAIADKTTIVDAIYNINRTSGSGNCDVTLGWQSALEGSTFTTIADNQIGAAQYNSGAYSSFTGVGNNTTNTVLIAGVSTFAPFLVGKNAVLPVTLTSFTAQKQASGTQLKWNTASEQNNSHFDVQRSADGVTFLNVGKVNGAGNSNASLDYNFTDKTPASGTNYYRLSQVDFDGKTTLSNPVSVNISFVNSTMQVYAMPNSANLIINISTDIASAGQLIVYNLNGQKVYEQAVSLTKGNNDLSINLSNTDKGIFIATYSSDTQLLKKKFIR